MACHYDPTCLGMCEWTGCPGALLDEANLELQSRPTTPPTNQATGQSTCTASPVNVSTEQARTLSPATSSSSLTSKQQDSTQRFQFATEEELAELAKGLIPLNTSRSTTWALKTFIKWMTACLVMRRNLTTQCHMTFSLAVTLSFSTNIRLVKFVVEIRKSKW